MTSRPRYAELHAHSCYSFLDGASTPAELAAQAVELDLSALALTDHDGMYGVVQFSQAAKKVGLPTVFGSELRFGSQLLLGELGPRTGVPDPDGDHLLFLARSPQGYRHLSAQIGLGHLRPGKKAPPQHSLTDIASGPQDQLLLLTGGRKSRLRRTLQDPDLSRSEQFAAARTELEKLKDLFGRQNVVVEITATATAQDAALHATLADLAGQSRVGLVATGNVHYAKPSGSQLATAMSALRANRSVEQLAGWYPGGPVAYLRSAEEMHQLHHRYPHAVEYAHELGQECAFDLSLVAPNLPPYPVPDGHTEDSWLWELVRSGGQERYGSPTDPDPQVQHAWKVLEHEMKIILNLGFSGYFLIVYYIMKFCASNGILAQGRGSAANSAVCYALGITAVDAVRHGLLFERFLSPERDGPPDIDVDIDSERREEVIQHLFDRFGRTHAAQVANVITYRPRSAVRDAARALGYEPSQAETWSKKVERWGKLRRGKVLQRSWGRKSSREEVVQDAKNPEDAIAQIPEPVLDLAEELMGLPRHLGIHSGGMVMCDRPVIEVCPVQWATKPGRTVLQWDKEDCADGGLVKFDLLGLGMLTAISWAFDQIKKQHGVHLELHTLPDDDPKVYDLLCAADTIGVFQVESRAQMSTLPRLKPRCFYDIVVEVALIRPGPIQGQSVHPYLERRRDPSKISYTHELLRPCLERTLGVPLFQEQLMQMAVDAAGFNPAQADQLRRAMGSKRSTERMEELRAELMAGMRAKGIPETAREEIYEKLQAFADFGFPESHAFSFAYLVYASAWLKVHYPAAFYAGLLASQPMGFYSPQSLTSDARRRKVVIGHPCINRSETKSVVENMGEEAGFGVRIGLDSVRGIGQDLAEKIVVERRSRGPFQSIGDLSNRIGLSDRQLEALASAGAFDVLEVERRSALWAAGAAAHSGPQTLPGLEIGVTAPELAALSPVEKTVSEIWATGISVGEYPTEHVREQLKQSGVLSVAEVFQVEGGRRISVAGVVTHRQRPGTAKGVTFLSLEDESGMLNVVCSPGLWRRFATVARNSKSLIIRGQVERNSGAVNLVAEHLSAFRVPAAGRSRDFR